MNKNKTSGFGLIGVILAIVGLFAIGFIGWRLYETYKPTPISETPKSENHRPNTAPVDPNHGHVVIKEWSVRFKPVDGLIGLQYFRPLDASGDTITFTTEALAQTASRCAPSSGNFALGSLTRSRDKLAYGQELGPIDGFYYYLLGPQAACSDDPNVHEGPVLQQLFKSIPTLEAAAK